MSIALSITGKTTRGPIVAHIGVKGMLGKAWKILRRMWYGVGVLVAARLDGRSSQLQRFWSWLDGTQGLGRSNEGDTKQPY